MTAPLMTLPEIRLASRQRADRVILGGDYTHSFIPDDELNSYINQSLFELQDLLIARYESYYYVKTQGFITDGQNDQYPLASDFYKLLGVDLQISQNATGSNGYLSLRKFEMVDRNKFSYPNTQVVYGVLTNLRYKLTGNNLWLVPRAGAGQTLRIWYVPKLAPLADYCQVQFISKPNNNDTITIQKGNTPAVTYTAVPGAPSNNFEFEIGSTVEDVATNFTNTIALNRATGVRAYVDATPSYVDLTTIDAEPVTVTFSNVAGDLAVTPDRWSYMADGIGGWLEYVIVDVAIKMLQKEESDVSVLMAQKQALTKRIEEMSHNRDAGAPSSVRDVQGANPYWPGAGGGGYARY